MKIRQLIVFAAILLTGLAAAAQSASPNYLHIYTNGSWVVLDLDKVDRLEFNANNMVAKDKNNAEVGTYPRTTLQTIYVDESKTTAITDIADETAAAAAFTYDPATRTATMNADGNFTIYSVSGTMLLNIPQVKKGETVDMQSITPGVVILRSGRYSLKVAIN